MKWPLSVSTTSWLSGIFCGAVTGISATTYYTLYAGSACKNAVLKLIDMSINTPEIPVNTEIKIGDDTYPLEFNIPKITIDAELLKKLNIDFPGFLTNTSKYAEQLCKGEIGTHAAQITALVILAGCVGFSAHKIYQMNKEIARLAKKVDGEEDKSEYTSLLKSSNV